MPSFGQERDKIFACFALIFCPKYMRDYVVTSNVAGRYIRIYYEHLNEEKNADHGEACFVADLKLKSSAKSLFVEGCTHDLGHTQLTLKCAKPDPKM